jgi:arginyl-tRNA--protein-N-Asp/Glu arginylyltransferase
MALQPVKEIAKDYDWSLGKLAKDFYESKFGPGIMSAAKVKEMLTSPEKSNFNSLLAYDLKGKLCGYSIGYSSRDIMHYSYPFYDMDVSPKDMGLGMMIMAIQYAKETGKQFVYLGSLQRPGDTYKLQFEGLEWFDGGDGGGESGKWRSDIEEVKKVLASASM